MSHRKKMGLGNKLQRQKKRSLELRREQGKGNRPSGEGCASPDFFILPVARGPSPAAFTLCSSSFFCSSFCFCMNALFPSSTSLACFLGCLGASSPSCNLHCGPFPRSCHQELIHLYFKVFKAPVQCNTFIKHP